MPARYAAKPRTDYDGRESGNIQLKMLTKDQMANSDGPEGGEGQEGEGEGEESCLAAVRTFALDQTTAHGFPNIFRARTLFERSLWIVIFTAGFVATLYQGTMFILKFRQFPVNTEVKIVSKARLPFPSVTVCNTNKLRRSVVEKSKYQQMLVVDEYHSLPYYAPCLQHDFECRDRPVCIKRYLMCDAIRQCGKDDPSDEEGCDYESRTCTAQQFRCVHSGSGRGLCIPLKDKCNRVKDCYEGEDEDECQCKSSEFRCTSRGGCIAKTDVCNGVTDCLDGSDELPDHCGVGAPNGTCDGMTRFRCLDGLRCILMLFVCDNTQDCDDGSDEWACAIYGAPTADGEIAEPPAQGSQCGPEEFFCSGKCIDSGWTCDGEVDCPDGSDEAVDLCGRPHCTLPKVPCPIGGGCGVPCDLNPECFQDTDERNCSCEIVSRDTPNVVIQKIVCRGKSTIVNIVEKSSLKLETLKAQCGVPPKRKDGYYHCEGVIDCYNAQSQLPEPCSAVRTECFIAPDGRDYQGSVTDPDCLPWSHDRLASLNYTGRHYPELEGAESGSTVDLRVCRNPGGTMGRPGCFVPNGTESPSFTACQLSPSPTCHDDTFEVTLLADEDGSSEEASQGRVEVRYGPDVAGTIADQDWSLDEAHVVCKQLGYPAGALTNATETSVPSRGRPLLTDVRCTGYERNLIDCFYRYVSDGDADNLKDVVVACNTSITVIRRRKRSASIGPRDESCPFCSQQNQPTTDETFPNGCWRPGGKFRCGSGEEVPCWQTCNKFPDCEDGSDEWMVHCPKKSSQCPRDSFQCQEPDASGGTLCRPKSFICDSYNDCGPSLSPPFKSSDELRCPEPNEVPPKNYFKCKDENIFLHEYKVCNTEQDCLRSDDDEKDCLTSGQADVFKDPFEDPYWFLPYVDMLGVDQYFLFDNFTAAFRAPPFGRVRGEDPPDWDGFVTFSATPDYSDLVPIAKIPREEVRQLGHQQEDFILQCTYEQEKCNMSDIEVIQDDKYGNCYTFNDKSDARFSSKTGSTYGLQMTLFLEQSEYISVYGQEAGVRVAINPPHIKPTPADSGVTVTPGTVTSVGLRYNYVVRKGPPYGKCKKTVKKTKVMSEGEIRLSSEAERYDRASCLETCLHGYIRDYCQCSDTIQLNGPRCKMLNTTQEICRQLVYYLYQHNELPCSDECPLQCTDVYYTKTTSMSKWPSEKFVTHLFRNIYSINNKTKQLNEENVFDNIVRLEVFYEEFNYESTKEIPAYTEGSLFGDIGGIVGLYIGFSLITVCEFISLGLKLFKRFCCSTTVPTRV